MRRLNLDARLTIGAFIALAILTLTTGASTARADQKKTLHTLQYAMVALQAVDSLQSGTRQRIDAKRDSLFMEHNFQMKPFAHGGAPMYLVGYASYDLLGSIISRRWSAHDKIYFGVLPQIA